MGITAANIIYLAECYAEPEEEFRKSIYFTEKLAKRNIVFSDIKSEAEKIKNTIEKLKIEDVKRLHDDYDISLVEYTDMLFEAIQKKKDFKIQSCAKALLQIAIDYIYFNLQQDIKYKKIAAEREEQEEASKKDCQIFKNVGRATSSEELS